MKTKQSWKKVREFCQTNSKKFFTLLEVNKRRLFKWTGRSRGRIFKWFESKSKVLKEIFDSSLKIVRFYTLYLAIRTKNRAIFWFHTHILTLFFLSFCYFAVLIMLCISVAWFIDTTPLIPQILTYFITAAAMIGSVLAIVFSLKTLIMQNAADNSSAGFYRTLGKDKRQDLVFFILLFSVIFFVISSLTAASHAFLFLHTNYDLLRILFPLSIFIIGLDLYLVFLLYEMLFKKIDPFSAIALIQKSSIEYLEEIRKRAQQFANLMMLHPKTDKETKPEEMLATVFQSFRTDLQYISYRLSYLFDYHDKVLARNDRTASLSILDVIASILEKYFSIRKDSSILLPSGFFFVSSSDSQDFLTPHLERLVSVGLDYLKREDAVGIRKVISLFQELVGYAGEMKFIGSRIPENPILMQCRGYLDQFMESIIQASSFEGLFQGARAYGAIGAYITSKKIFYEITPIYDMLDKIAFAALLKKQDVVLTAVLDAYSAQIAALAQDTWLFEQKVELLFEHIQKIVIWGFTMYGGHSIEERRMQQDLAKPYENLLKMLRRLAQQVHTLAGRRKENAKGAVIEGLDKLRASLRHLSENLKNADSLLIQSLAQVTEEGGILAISLIENPDWINEKRELSRISLWYISQPKWFTHNVTQIESNLAFNALPEAVAKMGITAVRTHQGDIVEESVEVISQFANEMLQKEAGNRFGFTEPRIMVLACYIGIYALKNGLTNVIAKLKVLIPIFEQAYRQMYFSQPLPPGVTVSSPSENQLMVETVKIIDEMRNLNRRYGMLENTEELLLSLVNETDVRNFIREIWNVEVN